MAPVALRLSHVTLDTPDVRALLGFYARLLGWPVETEEEEWGVLRNPDGGTSLGFQREQRYRRPVWPSQPGDQQMMLHLEIQVDDLASASAHALSCGATPATFQPQEDVRVHLDPDGHPFCLYL